MMEWGGDVFERTMLWNFKSWVKIGLIERCKSLWVTPFRLKSKLLTLEELSTEGIFTNSAVSGGRRWGVRVLGNHGDKTISDKPLLSSFKSVLQPGVVVCFWCEIERRKEMAFFCAAIRFSVLSTCFVTCFPRLTPACCAGFSLSSDPNSAICSVIPISTAASVWGTYLNHDLDP